MSTLINGLPEHLRVGLTAAGNGPADPPDPEFDHWGCWCGDAGCTLWLKRRPFLVVLGLPDPDGKPRKREATDADLQKMAEDPAWYEPRGLDRDARPLEGG